MKLLVRAGPSASDSAPGEAFDEALCDVDTGRASRGVVWVYAGERRLAGGGEVNTVRGLADCNGVGTCAAGGAVGSQSVGWLYTAQGMIEDGFF